MSPDAPVVRWDPHQGMLVDGAGRPVTDAQEYKARRILDLGLIELTRWYQSGGGVVREYDCRPLPGCKQTHTLRHTRGPAGESFNCSCQWARGTARSSPGRCAHMLALSRYIRGASAS